ncbi:hypothetical protein ASPCAL06072 [Aspergillus calidoustus]|uniref:F-box domain-containing protein n=1 Tax=Aspergillus calidoustus TaxID=454130 RepID=A0A0U5GVG9_ASPCI|nr:hypothetical protein ASPCAL06072 [Aspergillus calidoustus]
MSSAESRPLDNLPTELQTSIIRHLDPITLIALSQTNTYYRALISPRKPHFVERLLALECDERYGGPPITVTRFGKPVPDCESAEWEANRWACTSCLKLRPHYAFTNQALLRLAYRKPPAAAQRYVVTSWEPTGVQRRERRKKKKKKSDNETNANLDSRWDLKNPPLDGNRQTNAQAHGYSLEEREIRKRTRIVMGGVWNEMPAKHNLTTRLAEFRDSGIPAFQEMTLEQFALMGSWALSVLLENDAQELSLLRAGTNRHQRRCIECRFHRNEFNNPRRASCDSGGGLGDQDRIGPDDITILPCRQRTLDTPIDRYFPGVCDVLEHKRPAGIAPQLAFRVGRTDAYDASWTTYRLRCPRCKTWKEIRAFRFDHAYPMWRPNAVDGKNYVYTTWDTADVTLGKLRCNHCFAAQSGRGALGKELVRWLEVLLGNEILNIQATLAYGFGIASRNAGSLAYKITSDTVPTSKDARKTRFTRDDVVKLRERWEQWMATGDITASVNAYGNPLGRWIEQYADAEAMWYWLKGCLEEVSQDGIGDVLVEWALTRDRPVEC